MSCRICTAVAEESAPAAEFKMPTSGPISCDALLMSLDCDAMANPEDAAAVAACEHPYTHKHTHAHAPEGMQFVRMSKHITRHTSTNAPPTSGETHLHRRGRRQDGIVDRSRHVDVGDTAILVRHLGQNGDGVAEWQKRSV